MNVKVLGIGALLVMHQTYMLGQSLTGPSTATQGWPGTFSFCAVSAPGTKTWTTSLGSFECIGCTPTYPVTSIVSSANCESVELYYYHPFYTASMTVGISGTFGSATKTTLIIPDLRSQYVHTPVVSTRGCSDIKVAVRVTDSEFSDPSGLSRSGPNTFAQFPFKWLVKLPNKSSWTTLISEPGNTNQAVVPATPINDIGVRNGQVGGNQVVDSAYYETGDVVLHLGSLPDSLDGTSLLFQLEDYAGHYIYSDTLILSIEPVVAAPILNPNVFGSLVLPGIIQSYTSIFRPDHLYQWKVQGGTILSGANTDSILVKWGSPNQNANISLVSTRGICSDSVSVPMIVSFLESGDWEMNNKNELVTYPNPTQDLITIKVASGIVGQEYHVFNQIGQRVFKGKILSEKWSLDITGWAKGVYTIVAEVGDQEFAERFIVK